MEYWNNEETRSGIMERWFDGKTQHGKWIVNG
jgi:hypothetical protein